LLQQGYPFIKRMKQQWRIVCRIERLSGVWPKRERSRPEAMKRRHIHHTPQQHPMSAMHSVEITYSDHCPVKIQIVNVSVNSQINLFTPQKYYIFSEKQIFLYLRAVIIKEKIWLNH